MKELLREIVAVLKLRKENHVKYIQTEDNPPNGYAAVLIPDWQVLQWIDQLDTLASELDTLAELEPANSPCGHPSQYAYTADGGKHIVCLLCEYLQPYRLVAKEEDLPAGRTRVLMFVRSVGWRMGEVSPASRDPWRVVDPTAMPSEYNLPIFHVAAYINLDMIPKPTPEEMRLLPKEVQTDGR